MGATDVERKGIREKEEGKGKKIELANTYFFKGRKSLAKGNQDEALRMFRATVAIHEEVYGTYDRRTARSYFFLAQTLFKETNEVDRALTAYRRAYRVGLSLDGLGLSKDGDHKYVQGAKRAIRELLCDKKSFDAIEVKTFFSSIVESVRLEKEGIENSDKSNFDRALESFEKCFAIEEKAEGTFPLDLGHLYVRIAEVHGRQGDHGMAIGAYRSALSIYESAMGREYADSIFCLRAIESCLHEMNLSNGAIQEYRESIFTSLEHCGKGDAYIESKMFREAVKEYEEARMIEEKSLGNYPLTASYIRRKLGLALCSLKEYDRAILELRTALSINIFECGDDHKSVVATLQDIRFVMGEKGFDFPSVNKYMNTVVFSVKHERYGEHLLLEKREFSEAIEEFQKSLGLEVSALGKFHLTQGGLFKSIGDAFLQTEKFDFAIVNYRNALVVYQQILGNDHDYTIAVLSAIGDAAHGIGLTKDRIDEYTKTVSESIFAEKEAENLIRKGDIIDAIAAYRRAARKEGLLLGSYHLSTADLHGKVAKLLTNMGRYDSAIVSYRCILAINLKSLGMDHMNTEGAYEDLLNAAVSKGLKREDAVKYVQNAKLSIENEDDGDDAMRNKNFGSAINNYKKAIGKEESFLGEDHLVTEGIIRKILECHRLSGKIGQAFHFYRKMIRIYMMHGAPDYDTEYMLHSLETTVHDLGLSETQKAEYIDIVKESVKCEIDGDSAEESKDYPKAIDSYSRCLMMEQSLLGMLHPSTWSVHKKIGSTFQKHGDIESAIISHSKALAILESYLGLKEKETTESFNDLLNATLPMTRQVDSMENKDPNFFPEDFFDTSSFKRTEYKEGTKKKEKKQAGDIYTVFASLRTVAPREENSKEAEKMEILEGLAQKWNSINEIGSIADITDYKSGNLSEEHTNRIGENSNSRTKRVSTKAQSKNQHDSPSLKTKELDRANNMASVLKNSQDKNLRLKTAIISFSKKTSGGTKKGGIGNLIGSFGTRQKGDLFESGEATQQNPVPNESAKVTQQHHHPTPVINTTTKNVNEAHSIPEIPSFNAHRKSKMEVPEIPAFDVNRKTTMEIPEIPAFNFNRSSERETKTNHGGSMSSDSSVSSYESYESA